MKEVTASRVKYSRSETDFVKGEKHPHKKLINDISKESQHVLHSSGQGIFIYLDDEHKVCNEQLAKMLGYKSAAEWSKPPTVLDDIVPGDQEKVIHSYRNAVEKYVGSTIDVTFRNRSGKKRPFKGNILLVPVGFHGEVFSLNCVTKK